MNMPQAVVSCFRHSIRFQGRASRSEYWWFVLFGLIVAVPCAVADARMGTKLFGLAGDVVMYLPGCSVAVRRLHDRDRTGWWYLGFVLLVPFAWVFMRGTPGPNRFGPDPVTGPTVKAAEAGEADLETAWAQVVDDAIRRLASRGRGVSVPMSGVTDEVTFDLGAHDAGGLAYAVFTRDADGVALQLDLELPDPLAPDFDAKVSRLAVEVAYQGLRRLPRMTRTEAEDVWARVRRTRVQPTPVRRG